MVKCQIIPAPLPTVRGNRSSQQSEQKANRQGPTEPCPFALFERVNHRIVPPPQTWDCVIARTVSVGTPAISSPKIACIPTVDFLTVAGYNKPNIVRNGGVVVPRQGLTTEIVVGVAALLAEEIGAENLTLHKLANRLNIKPASLYTHISGIEQLYVLLSNLALKQLGTAMMEAVKDKKRGEAIRAISAAYRDYAKQNPEMYRMIMKVPYSHSEQLVNAGKNVKAALFELLSQYTADRLKIIFLSRYYHSILHGFISLEQAGFFDDAISVDESLSKIVANFIEQLESISSI